MWWLSLMWIMSGVGIGLLSGISEICSVEWGHLKFLYICGIGVVGALAGGWLGTFIVGRYFATGMALWIAVVGCVMVPKCYQWSRGRMQIFVRKSE